MDIISLVIGIVIGGGVMFFIYGNNKNKMSKVYDKVAKELYEANEKIKKLKNE